jgi:peptide-methionine (R)-S-oxide reductase
MRKKVVKTDQEWKEQLTPEQHRVIRMKGTERAFTGDYYSTKDKGMYRCAACGSPLFASETKYDSGSGWPSFWAPVDGEAVRYREDSSHGMHRTEVLCAACEAHLGHLFEDGPRPTGQRFCINSVSLKLERESKGDTEEKVRARTD